MKLGIKFGIIKTRKEVNKMKTAQQIKGYIMDARNGCEETMLECARNGDDRMLYRTYSDSQDYLMGLFDMALYMSGLGSSQYNILLKFQQETFNQLRCSFDYLTEKYNCR